VLGYCDAAATPGSLYSHRNVSLTLPVCARCLPTTPPTYADLCVQVVKALLEAGASPEYADRVSMESAFDVAQSEAVRAVLVRAVLSVWVVLLQRVAACVGGREQVFGSVRDDKPCVQSTSSA
jgi:hypothetical protein